MKYLITDPFGIGEQLILYLIKQNESVFTIYPNPKEVPMSFLGKKSIKYGFLRFDQDRDYANVLPKRVKYVIHLYDRYSGPFTSVFRSNVYATLLLLDWARKVHAEKFVFLSSGEVYGKGTQVDEHTAFDPHSFYATTKFETEYLFRYYKSAFSINTLRVFFPFGRNVRAGLITDLKEAIATQKSFQTEYKTISPTFASDVVDVVLNILKQDTSDVYNVCGSPVEVTALVEKIGQVMGKTPPKVQSGTSVLTGSNVLIGKKFNFKETPFDEALQQSFAP